MKLKTLIPVVAAALLAAGAFTPAAAQDTKKQEKERARLQKEIAILNDQLKENSKAGSKALSDLSLLRKKISVQKELVADSDRRIKDLADSIAVAQDQIDLLQRRTDTLSLYYGRLVRTAYKNRDSRLWYMYILSSGDIGQAFRRFGYLRSFSRQMNSQAARLAENRAALETEKERLDGLRAQAEELRTLRVRDMEEVRADEGRAENLVGELNRQKKQYEKDLAAKNRQVDALNKEIARLIAKAQAEAAARAKKEAAKSGGGTTSSGGKSTSSGGKSVSTEVDARLSGEFASNKGRLPWPVEGTVVESYGQHSHPVYTNVKMPFNNGVTVAVAKGSSARAVFDGVVSNVVVMPGYNQCVLVQHGSYFTFYCKLKSVSVKAGDSVKTGQVLGVVDTIGGEDQFHFQLWSGKVPQDPETWLR